jgi:uncharacterized membrane protein YqaE (UPF0057 family)
MYLLAIILLPPVAALMAGKPIQALINLVLCLFFWLPGIIHAILAINEKKADKRVKKQANRND